MSLTDADFYQCNVTDPITIDVTVTDLPAELEKEDACGHWLRGVLPDGTVVDEPEPEAQRALTVRFRVDESLEPTWTLFKDALSTQEHRLSANRRAAFGCFQLDDSTQLHLRWAHGSALSHLTGTAGVADVITSAHRLARQVVYEKPPAGLLDASVRAGDVVRAIGATEVKNPRPGLDPNMVGRSNWLVLHDGPIPVTRLGLGSQRLASLAFQLEAAASESIVLVDEIERGLEPHRLMHLLAQLRDRACSGHGQVFLTTHSPLVVEAAPKSLFIMRCRHGTATIASVPSTVTNAVDPVPVIRSGPSSILARRVVVCEGKTEVGLCRSLARHWDSDAMVPRAVVGTVFRHGGGSRAPLYADVLAGLGYPTALLIDDDLAQNKNKDAWTKNVEKARAAGVQVIRWEAGYSVEEQITAILPATGLQAFVALAKTFIEAEDPQRSLLDSVASQLVEHLGSGVVLSGLDPNDWCSVLGCSMDEVRRALGRAAKKRGWFKDETRGERLGALLVRHLDAIQTSHPPFFALLTTLKGFAYELIDHTSTEAHP
ncbi:MAG: AAA family ATPase [Actinomycetota bacterium]|nr:AAA family ATPase [Actinomycetota bacterium]